MNAAQLTVSRWLMPTEVSKQTGIAVKTLANWRSMTTTGDAPVGPPFVKVGRMVRYDAGALAEWQAAAATAVAS